MIRAIIFDCFGVLVGTGYRNVFKTKSGNVSLDNSFLDELLDKANSNMISSNDLHREAANRLGIPFEEWKQLILEDEKANKEIFSYIQKSLKDNYKLALLSNAGTRVINRKLTPEHLSLFDAVVISGEVGLLKPDPRIFSLVAEKLEVDPAECIFIDDYEGYLSGAQSLGMQTIQFFDTKQCIRDISNIL